LRLFQPVCVNKTSEGFTHHVKLKQLHVWNINTIPAIAVAMIAAAA